MKYFLPTFITLILSIGLITVANAKPQSVFECSLPPFTFTMYETDILNGESTIQINKHNKPAYIRQSKPSQEGNGVCRHTAWEFDMEWPITVSEIGCYSSQDVMPENAKGYVYLDKHIFYCYKKSLKAGKKNILVDPLTFP